MTIEVRPLGADESQRAIRLIELSFGGEAWPEDALEVERRRFEADRSIGAFDGDDLVGHTGAYTFTMTVPGGPLGVAGVSMVGVLPTHRRRGVLRSLMRHQLTALHETGGEPVAALTASEPAIYGRFGYGHASDWASVEIPKVGSALRPVPGTDEVTIRYADAEKSLDICTAIRESVVATRPGMFRYTEPWARGEIADPPSMRGGASPLRCVVAERSGAPTGYAYFQTRQSWEQRGPAGRTTVQRVQATDLASYAALWRFLLDQDLMATTIHRRLAMDDPLLRWLVDIRQAALGFRDSLWVRLVEVGRALGSRTYTRPVDVVLEVRDEFCPWNAGRWHLAGDATGASCGRVTREPNLVLDIRDLASAYLGRPSLQAAGGAGLIEERTAGSLAAVSQAFLHDPLPLLDTSF
ncbi:GNAT family N-acetyltransferase [Actinopolymorpha alba]|uniref:GNAT family N-acetyltransferase n=1 Tax=Actinopolymorpha alba TaxID=533267 RepID=UPI00037FDC1C|nr:GNAT family N-acetyltransferase [Actinopolymorpha alba]